METGKQTWSATLYDSRHDYVARYGAALLEWLSPQPGEAILDLGCGTGDLSVRIAQAGAEVWGVDADPAMLAQARAKFPDLRFLQADAMALPDFGRTFDAVFSNAVLHWIPDLGRLAEGLARVLRPGGRFVAECGGAACNAGINTALRLTRRPTDCPSPTPPTSVPSPRWSSPSSAPGSALSAPNGSRATPRWWAKTACSTS